MSKVIINKMTHGVFDFTGSTIAINGTTVIDSSINAIFSTVVVNGSKNFGKVSTLPSSGMGEGDECYLTGTGKHIYKDSKWISISDSNTLIKTQEFIATTNQTLFTITGGTYKVGTNSLEVYIDGIRQHSSAFAETSSTSFTLSEGVEAGVNIFARYIEAGSPPASTSAHAATHAPGGGDGLDSWYIAQNQKGVNNGVASLGADGKVPAVQLPAMNYISPGIADTDVGKYQSLLFPINNRSRIFGYDAQGRVQSITTKSGSTTVLTTTFTYDVNSRVETVTEVAGGTTKTTTYGYNTDGSINTITRS